MSGSTRATRHTPRWIQRIGFSTTQTGPNTSDRARTPTHSQTNTRYGAGLLASSTPNTNAATVTANNSSDTAAAAARTTRESRNAATNRGSEHAVAVPDPRLTPEHDQGDEREDQHDRSPDQQVPERKRQVLAAAHPVCRDKSQGSRQQRDETRGPDRHGVS